jgi:hypothetical protein
MTDHQLSTRDLAAGSDSADPDSSLEIEQPADRTTGAIPTDGQDSGPGAESDASLTRDPASTRSAEPGAADTATDPAASGRTVGDNRMHATAVPDHEPLFPSDQSERFTSRWQEIQTSFVDQPRNAVAEADALVADLMQRLAASFSQERERLEAQWDRGDDVSTEDLRVALTRYRSFFDRLLSA